MPKKNKYGLTEKEMRFVEEYLIDFNATAAARRAGYRAGTYENLRFIGSRLLTKANIANALSYFKAERSRRVGVSQERVMQELARIAFACITDVVNIDGELKEQPNPNVDFLAYMEWKDNVAAISEIDERIVTDSEGNQKSTYKIKLHDKLKALSLLMKHLGMLNDFDMSIACLREKYGLSLTRDDNGTWEVIDLSKVAVSE